MKDNFEIALNELYTRASAAHVDAGGFDAAPMIATARRKRQMRTAAVAVTTAAAVVGVGFGGASAVRLLEDGRAAAPAATTSPTLDLVPPPVTGTELDAACGTVVADLMVLTDDSWRVEAGLDEAEVASGAQVTGWYSVLAGGTALAEPSPDTEYLVVRDGVVVGSGAPVGDASATPVAGRVPVRLDLQACPAGGPLEPGDYELYVGTLSTFVPADGPSYDALVLADPLGLTVTAAPDDTETDGADTPETPQAQPYVPVDPGELVHEVSSSFVDGAPLTDGDYVGQLLGRDPAAGTIDVDLVQFYLNDAADRYVAEHGLLPGYAYDNYFAVNDVEQATTLRVDPAATVGEVCFNSGEGIPRYVSRTVPQWLVAPSHESAETFECSQGQALHGSLYYWLRVRDGVVVQVTGQYTP